VHAQDSAAAAPGLKGMLQGLEEMWDESQYEDYSLDSFLQSMK